MKKKITEKKKPKKTSVVFLELISPTLHPRMIFNGCKIVHWDPKNAFVHKDKYVCTMKKCMVSIATINMIFEHGHVHTKLVIYPLLFILDY